MNAKPMSRPWCLVVTRQDGSTYIFDRWRTEDAAQEALTDFPVMKARGDVSAHVEFHGRMPDGTKFSIRDISVEAAEAACNLPAGELQRRLDDALAGRGLVSFDDYMRGRGLPRRADN